MITFEQAWKEYSEKFYLDATIEEYDSMKLGWALAKLYNASEEASEKETASEVATESILYHYAGDLLGEDGERVGYIEGLIERTEQLKLEHYHNIRDLILRQSDLPTAEDVRLTSFTKVS
ncbi:amino acid transporter [Synechococcus phage S-CRM01]|uniref:amino acid transporter n=1 Tax=Synechococcus phage S-CRM01 TaxID=1026955 RepID=UPI000209E30E|nr:amino acid transporter [Synechococcus phage S-CRM01]AEC53220.1 amino acid transporter [Synechococcus phage S-CRM01]